MKFTDYFAPTLKETPADADTASAKLMLRAGMVRKVASGLYDWLPLGFRVLRKVESVIREEMDRAGALEVWMPHIQPRELWEESGRWGVYGKELLRMKDRKDADFCFAPTAEEVITDLARRDLRSYRDLPKTFYQFGTKFRDEIRPRFGVMRAREFYMKDAYSFHASEEDLDKTYQAMVSTYTAIFSRLGLKFRPVEADTGAIGGSSSHEFMVLADTGEEHIATCGSCGYTANVEKAESKPVPPAFNGRRPDPQDVATPGLYRVEDVATFMKVKPEQIIKTVFLIVDGRPVVALLRGDTDLNESKLLRFLNAGQLRPAREEEYRAVSGCDPGYAGPRGLKARVIADYLIPAVVDGVGGGGKKDVHVKNLNYGRDYKADLVGDIRNVRPNDPCPRCDGSFSFFRGIEVGHVFKLGTKYSKSMKAAFLDSKGEARPMVMGCYGIGVSRIVAAAVEQNHDQGGIQWPVPIAPFEAIVTPTNVSEPSIKEAAKTIYAGLKSEGVDVILDDRDLRAGVKFKDADLLGFPVRVTVGDKSLAAGAVELKERTVSEAQSVPVAKAVQTVASLVRKRRTFR